MPVKKMTPAEAKLVDVGINYVPNGGIPIYVGGLNVLTGQPHSWQSIADNQKISVQDLIRFNYQTTIPEVVNFYMERNCGCKVIAADGKNYRFVDAHPGFIYVPAFAPIVKLDHHTILPMDMRQHPTTPHKYQMKATFQVHLELNSKLEDPSLYEYRQEIRGSGFLQQGEWVGGLWRPKRIPARPGSPLVIAPPIPIPPDTFPIPGVPGVPKGLLPNWKEDGIVDGSVTRLYGHRPADFVNGLEQDKYSPDKLNGHSYLLGDQPGLDGDKIEGLRVFLNMEFIGSVVRFDKMPGVPGRKIIETVAKRNWSYSCERKIKRVSPLNAVP
jgi:hypothetical protein